MRNLSIYLINITKIILFYFPNSLFFVLVFQKLEATEIRCNFGVSENNQSNLLTCKKTVKKYKIKLDSQRAYGKRNKWHLMETNHTPESLIHQISRPLPQVIR